MSICLSDVLLSKYNTNFVGSEIITLDNLNNQDLYPTNAAVHKKTISAFKYYTNNLIVDIIHKINGQLGIVKYKSTEKLSKLGIILNCEIGYFIHVASITELNKNSVFQLNTKFTSVIKNILYNTLDIPEGVDIDPLALKKDCLHLIKSIDDINIICKSRRCIFPITFNPSLDLSNPILKPSRLGELNVLNSPEHFIPVVKSFQCNFCLKGSRSEDVLINHINKFHKFNKKVNKSTDFISKSTGQLFPFGFLNVSTSNDINNSSDKPHKDTGLDDMPHQKFFREFINSWKKDGCNNFKYYFQTTKSNKFQKLHSFVHTIIMNGLILWMDEFDSYEWNKNLKIINGKYLKFYNTSTPVDELKFEFSELSSYESIEIYSNILATAIILLFACINIEENLIEFNENPKFQVEFNETERKFGLKLFKQCLTIIDDDSPKILKVTKKDRKINNYCRDYETNYPFAKNIFNNVTSLLVLITCTPLHKDGFKSTLGAIFCILSIKNQDSNILEPTKRLAVYKKLLYGIRISFIYNVKSEDKYSTIDRDETYCLLIQNSTTIGVLKNIIEELYYPTVNSLKSLMTEHHLSKGLYNPRKFTFVYEVKKKRRVLGYKLVGLYTLKNIIDKVRNRMIDSLILLLDLTKYREIYKQNENKPITIDDLTFYNHLIISKFKPSNRYFETCEQLSLLLISYILLTNKPFHSTELTRMRSKNFKIENIGDDMVLKFITEENMETRVISENHIIKIALMILGPIRNATIKLQGKDKAEKLFFTLDSTYTTTKLVRLLEMDDDINYLKLTRYLYKLHHQMKEEINGSDPLVLRNHFLNKIRTSARIRKEGLIITDLEALNENLQIPLDQLEVLQWDSYWDESFDFLLNESPTLQDWQKKEIFMENKRKCI